MWLRGEILNLSVIIARITCVIAVNWSLFGKPYKVRLESPCAKSRLRECTLLKTLIPQSRCDNHDESKHYSGFVGSVVCLGLKNRRSLARHS